MPKKMSEIINIALVGGGQLSTEVLEKTLFDDPQERVSAPIVAVADPNPKAPAMVIAKKLGLLTVTDYHDLYDPRHSIHLIVVLNPKGQVFEEILNTRPIHIRVLSYHVFKVFWEAIGLQERKLRDRTREMETILNGIQDFISVITPQMEIEEVNEAFLKQMRCSREDVIGRKCYEVFQGVTERCNSEEIACPLDEVIRNKRPTRHVMNRMNSKGVLSHFEVHVFPIWEKDGKISKFIEITRDITARLKEEEEITRRLEQMVEERTQQLEETHAKLIHKDKMASLGKLSASVVHEINNPIAGILNLIILMKRIIEEDDLNKNEIEQFCQYLTLMETETRRISRIVSNLLAFSRQSKMEPKRVNINQLIEQTLVINSNLLKINGVKVEKALSVDLPDLIGSQDQLQQVMMNIVSNAAEAVEATGGGTLRIETRHALGADKIYVTFKDSGIGIPRENFSKLFEPFFTTKKKGKGVGLGLSVAYGIVREHGGTINVASEVGKGTTFELELPREYLTKAVKP
ncbi:MAG: ATP-binding protein [Desulfobacterales bacterium]|nr:ATP-binding protein [Desulfobacterales bacterium]